MRVERDHESDTAYLYVTDAIADGQAVTQVTVQPPGSGQLVLDFDQEGHLLGIEVLGATAVLPPGH